MIDQVLRLAEAQRLRIQITDEQVDAAYNNFAKSNKMQVKQLDGIMAQSGVTKAHFKEFIRSQMAWNQAVGMRGRSGSGTMSEQDVVRRMLQQGGAKPTATEYMLQQVIFVVPASERGNMAKRKREAEAMRARFNGCNNTREFAKGLLDVTVRDLGRKLAPELPPDWAEQIKNTKVGGATGVRETACRRRVHRHLLVARGVRRPRRQADVPDRGDGRQRQGLRGSQQEIHRRASREGDDRQALTQNTRCASPATPRPLAMSIGDPSGIGPEIAMAAWLLREQMALPAFYLLCDPGLLAARADRLGWQVPFAETTPLPALTPRSRPSCRLFPCRQPLSIRWVARMQRMQPA